MAELTEHVGLNHNAVRQHLAKLVEAGARARVDGVGRGAGSPPARVTRSLPAPTAGGGSQGPYERLSLWLAEMVRTGDPAVEVGTRVGRRRVLGATGSVDPVDELVHQMASHGFEPLVHRAGRRADITLRTCPFASTTLADPDTVCELHLGIAYGIAENLDGLVIDQLVPHDPRRANCRLRCRLTGSAAP